jgi:hypothetical protein
LDVVVPRERGTASALQSIQGGEELLDTDPLPLDVREQYTREYGPMIDEGIDVLKRALELRPEYDDAMAYLNLLYRRKAGTVAYVSERDELLQMADDLIDKVKEIKEKRMEATRSQPQ